MTTIAPPPPTFNEVFMSLPETADPADEIDFVRSHPAMVRYTDLDEGEKLTISGEDILDAPSKSAAIQLKHHVNKPADFFKQVLSEHKKKEAKTGSETERHVDMPLREVRLYLDQVKARKKNENRK